MSSLRYPKKKSTVETKCRYVDRRERELFPKRNQSFTVSYKKENGKGRKQEEDTDDVMSITSHRMIKELAPDDNQSA
jgi:hypothetical protein